MITAPCRKRMTRLIGDCLVLVNAPTDAAPIYEWIGDITHRVWSTELKHSRPITVNDLGVAVIEYVVED
jgi:hypothetical protein